MNKLLLNSLFALLVLAGGANLAQAISIPEGEDAKNGPAPWLVPAYNNTSSSLAAGSVVIWDIGSSTGDNDNYVNTTTTRDTYIVAGVVYPNAIAAGDTGTIATHGVVPVTVTSAGVTDAGPVCSSTTAGAAVSCSTNAAAFGIATATGTSGNVNVMVNTRQ